MDFNDGLPQSANANCILVIVDKFTRYGHFFTIVSPLYGNFSGWCLAEYGLQTLWNAFCNCL
jgi:hypothetical protein